MNWYGTYTLFIREVRRFLKVYHQTLIAPVVSALIFLSIFTLAIGEKEHKIHGIPYIDFVGYGLIIMTIIQNAFANTSSSLIMAKVLGYINDILMTPLGGIEIVLSYTLGAIVRGITVGIILASVLWFIIDFRLNSFGLLVFYVLSSCILLANLGIISSIITNNFDQNSVITNYIITPLSFLSGTFFSIHQLPNWLKIINLANPFFYIIDGFRYSLTGFSDGSVPIGMMILIITNVAMIILNVIVINSGWKLKQ